MHNSVGVAVVAAAVVVVDAAVVVDAVAVGLGHLLAYCMPDKYNSTIDCIVLHSSSDFCILDIGSLYHLKF